MDSHVRNLKRRPVVEEEDPAHQADRLGGLQFQQALVVGTGGGDADRHEGLGNPFSLALLQVVEDRVVDNCRRQGWQDLDWDEAGLDHEGLLVDQPQPFDLVDKIIIIKEEFLLNVGVGGHHLVVEQLDALLLAVKLEAVGDPQVAALVVEERLILQVERVDEGPRPTFLEDDPLLGQDPERPLDRAATDPVVLTESALVGQAHSRILVF